MFAGETVGRTLSGVNGRVGLDGGDVSGTGIVLGRSPADHASMQKSVCAYLLVDFRSHLDASRTVL